MCFMPDFTKKEKTGVLVEANLNVNLEGNASAQNTHKVKRLVI